MCSGVSCMRILHNLKQTMACGVYCVVLCEYFLWHHHRPISHSLRCQPEPVLLYTPWAAPTHTYKSSNELLTSKVCKFLFHLLWLLFVIVMISVYLTHHMGWLWPLLLRRIRDIVCLCLCDDGTFLTTIFISNRNEKLFNGFHRSPKRIGQTVRSWIEI